MREYVIPLTEEQVRDLSNLNDAATVWWALATFFAAFPIQRLIDGGTFFSMPILLCLGAAMVGGAGGLVTKRAHDSKLRRLVARCIDPETGEPWQSTLFENKKGFLLRLLENALASTWFKWIYSERGVGGGRR